MRAGGSKAKGAEFERYVCRRLSGWISGGVRDDLFWRSAMSGGRATIGVQAGKARTAQAGDVSALGGSGGDARIAALLLESVLVECKHVANYNLNKWIFERGGFIGKAWQQALDACGNTPRVPFLVVRENRGRTLVITDIAVRLVLLRRDGVADDAPCITAYHDATAPSVICQEIDWFFKASAPEQLGDLPYVLKRLKGGEITSNDLLRDLIYLIR